MTEIDDRITHALEGIQTQLTIISQEFRQISQLQTGRVSFLDLDDDASIRTVYLDKLPLVRITELVRRVDKGTCFKGIVNTPDGETTVAGTINQWVE